MMNVRFRSWLGAIGFSLLMLGGTPSTGLSAAAEAELFDRSGRSRGRHIALHLWAIHRAPGRCIRDGIWAEKLRDRKFLWSPASRRGRW